MTPPARAARVPTPVRVAPGCPPADVGRVPVRFSAAVRLTRPEAFAACQALADAEPFLRHAGRHHEACGLGDLFELLEDRLTARPPV